MSGQDFAQHEILEARISRWDLCVGILPALAVLPVFLGQGILLWRNPETKLGLLVWVAVAIIVAWRARGNVSRHMARMWAAILIYAIATCCLCIGVLNWSFNWIHFATALYLITWSMGLSKCRWHEGFGWGGLLILTIPVPHLLRDWDASITSLAATAASKTLDAHGVPHLLDMLSFHLKSGSFAAPSATSSRFGIYAVLCCTALWSWMRSRSLFHSIILLMGSSLGLLITQYLAILIVSLGFIKYSNDWTASGVAHYLISCVAFIVTLAIMFLFDRLLAELLSSIPTDEPRYFPIFAAANKILTWPTSLYEPTAESETGKQHSKVRQQLHQWRQSWYCFDWSHVLSAKLIVYTCTAISLLVALPAYLAILRNGLPVYSAIAPQLKLEDFRSTATAELLPAQWKSFRKTYFSINGKTGQSVDSEYSTSGKLMAKWGYQWNGVAVVADLNAPQIGSQGIAGLANSEGGQIQYSIRDSLKDDSWEWQDIRQSTVFGGNVYLYRCGLNDDLAPIMLSVAPSREWPIFQQLSGSANTLELSYEIRISCETGPPLSLEQIAELQEFFGMVRNSFKSKLPAGLLSKSSLTEAKR